MVATDIKKDFNMNILDACNILCKAWNLVTSDTIRQNFAKPLIGGNFGWNAERDSYRTTFWGIN